MALRFGSSTICSNGLLLHRTKYSAARMAFSSKYSGAGGDDDDVAQQEMKAKLKSAWGSAAENYVWNIQDPCSSSSPKVTMGMSVGYKLVARSVVSLSDKELGAPVVLDVASAGGEPAITIAKVIPGATVHATDIAPPMMDLIRRRAAEAGVSNVTASVADGEALTGFGDGSVDAVTCTWGLIFMPNWRKAIQEFSRVLKSDGLVAVTLWERHGDSIFERLLRVMDVLVPGLERPIDPEALGEDGASAVVGEMKAAGFCNVSVSRFSVPMVLSPDARPRDIWEFFTLSSTLGQMISSLEAKGRTNVRQEALDIFEGRMDQDWAEERTPLGLVKQVDRVNVDSNYTVTSQPSRVVHTRALVVLGRKRGV